MIRAFRGFWTQAQSHMRKAAAFFELQNVTAGNDGEHCVRSIHPNGQTKAQQEI